VAERLHDQNRRQDVGTAAAKLGRDRQTLDAELGAGPPGLRGKLTRLLALGQILVQFTAGEVDRRRLELLLFGAQREVQLLPPALNRAPRPATLAVPADCAVNISLSASILSRLSGQPRVNPPLPDNDGVNSGTTSCATAEKRGYKRSSWEDSKILAC